MTPIRCHQCGQAIPGDSKFCPFCGSPVERLIAADNLFFQDEEPYLNRAKSSIKTLKPINVTLLAARIVAIIAIFAEAALYILWLFADGSHESYGSILLCIKILTIIYCIGGLLECASLYLRDKFTLLRYAKATKNFGGDIKNYLRITSTLPKDAQKQLEYNIIAHGAYINTDKKTKPIFIIWVLAYIMVAAAGIALIVFYYDFIATNMTEWSNDLNLVAETSSTFLIDLLIFCIILIAGVVIHLICYKVYKNSFTKWYCNEISFDVPKMKPRNLLIK